MSVRPAGIVMEPVVAEEARGVHIGRTIGSERLVVLDPYLLLDHLTLPSVEAQGGTGIVGFPRHPHRGIETLTYVIAGSVHHKDSIGNDSRVGANGSQWMTAGSGIFHEEYLEAGPDGCEAVQIWFSLPAAKKMTSPGYQAANADQIPEVDLAGQGMIRVVAGEFAGVSGAFAGIGVSPTYLDVQLSPDASVVLPAERDAATLAYLVRGKAVFGENNKTVTAPSLVALGNGEQVHVASVGDEPLRFVFVSANPLREPIVQFRSIVMNTVDQMAEAIADLETGSFVR